jgi:small conductance mechanosensitive channel
MTSPDGVPNDKIKPDILGNSSAESRRNISLIKTMIILAAVIAIVIVVEVILEYQLHGRYKTILRVAEVSAIGYFASITISNACYKLTYGFLGKNAEALRVLIRIVGAVIIIAIIISYLSQDPLVATSIGTVTAIVIGFASQNILGNIIAGLYLAITRPFKIGDKVTVFGNTGIVFDIGLLYSKLKSEEGDIIIAPNSSMISTTVVIRTS